MHCGHCVMGIVSLFQSCIKEICSFNPISLGTHVTKKPPRHFVCIIFWSATGPNGPKMTIFGQKSQFWANFGRLWAKKLRKNHLGNLSSLSSMRHLFRVDIDRCSSNWPLGAKMCFFDPKIWIFGAKSQFFV